MTETEAPPSSEETAPAFSSPVPGGIWVAIRHYWILVLLPVIAFTAAGIVYGIRRHPTYTASAKLAVSKLDLTAPGALAGFTDATESLAQTFSRSIDATGVVDPAARVLGVPHEIVQARLSAVPVAQTPVFQVEATGPSEKNAVRLANAGSVALIAYLTKVNSTVPEARHLLAQYRRQALVVEHLRTARTAAMTAYTTQSDATTSYSATTQSYATTTSATTQSDGTTSSSATTQLSATTQPSSALLAVQQASAALQAAQLHLQTLYLSYQNAVENNPAPGLVQVIAPATAANSDRKSKLALFAFTGLVVGALIGLALASVAMVTRRRPF